MLARKSAFQRPHDGHGAYAENQAGRYQSLRKTAIGRPGETLFGIGTQRVNAIFDPHGLSHQTPDSHAGDDAEKVRGI